MTVTQRCLQRGIHLSAKRAKVMGGEYIPMILSLQWIIVFEETSELSETSAEFGFFPASTKMKAHWACASIFRWLKSYIICNHSFNWRWQKLSQNMSCKLKKIGRFP